MAPLKTALLRKNTKSELLSQLDEQKKELAVLRVAQTSGSNQAKVSRILHTRKSIARINTVISQTQRAELKKFYAGKKYLPIDLRAKKTRAIRRALTKEERNSKTQRQLLKEKHFPQRKYAVKA